jgi:hypothetical protein
MTRAERKALKKKTAEDKRNAALGKKPKGDGDDDEDDDEDLVNPNRGAQKRLNISDLSAPRELSRRERCVLCLIVESFLM